MVINSRLPIDSNISVILFSVSRVKEQSLRTFSKARLATKSPCPTCGWRPLSRSILLNETCHYCYLNVCHLLSSIPSAVCLCDQYKQYVGHDAWATDVDSTFSTARMTPCSGRGMDVHTIYFLKTIILCIYEEKYLLCLIDA